ncbi:MAG: hypothetical protein ACK2U9_00350, partial [Anaerolineae bacterium]
MPKPPTSKKLSSLKVAAPGQATPRLQAHAFTPAVRPTAGVVIANPRFQAAGMGKFRPGIIAVPGLGGEGASRDQLTVPISPAPEPTDTLLFEDPANPAKKYYLPRYRLR